MKATITLPWPDARLSPNARTHYMALARVKKAVKRTAYYIALEAGHKNIAADAVAVRYTFNPPNRRGYDLDNLIASMKAAADGIAEAIGVDDSKWHIAVAPVGPVVKNGSVTVELEWAAEEVAA